jgi:hypothetical protein
MLIKLPNGLIDGGDHFTHARIDELRGKQQNYLSNKDLVVGNIGHVPKILEDMILSLETESGMPWKGDIKEAIYKLPAGDLETVLLKVRENTYGSKYYHEAKCEHCEHLNKDLRLDLDKLEVKEMPLSDMLDKSKRMTVLPKSGLEVELKPLYLKDLFEAVKLATGKQDELVTTALAMSIKRLGDKSKVTSKDLEEISMSDLMHLNEFAEKVNLEGNIDTSVTTDCTSCKKEFTYKINVYDPSFFSPTKASKNSST